MHLPSQNKTASGTTSAFRSAGGFTFVEIIIAVAIGAAVITTGVLSYQAITASGTRWGMRGDVQLPPGTISNLYGLTGNYVSSSFAPNFSMAAQAESMRERLQDDLASASAVYCLGRNGRSTFRPSSIAMGSGVDARLLSTPAMFQSYLAALDSSSVSGFTSYQGASTATNASLFLLKASDDTSAVYVSAIYEVDMIPSTNPVGIYASVRRYEGATCTDFYHIFYEGETNTFQPLMVYFERDATGLTGDVAIDRYKQAANRPFYFMWWPDPAAPRLASLPLAESLTTSQPRAGYINMANRTSFFFVLPAFPPL